MDNTIGDKIRRLRVQNNLTGSDLAELLGVSKATISLWESGKTYPRPHMATRLGMVFSTASSLFLNEKKEETSDAEKELLLREISPDNKGIEDIGKVVGAFKRATPARREMIINMLIPLMNDEDLYYLHTALAKKFYYNLEEKTSQI